MHHAGLDDLAHLGLEHAFAEGVLHFDPLAVGHAVLGRVPRVDLDQRVGVHLAQIGDLLALGMEVAVRARARSEHERVRFGEVGRGHRGKLRFLVIGQRVFAELAEHGRVQLHAAGGRVEAGLAVGTQAAGLVLAVAAHLGLLVHHLFAQLFEALLVVQAVVGQEVVVVLVLLEVHGHAAQAQLVHDLAVALAVAHRDGLVHGTRHDGRRAVVGVHHRVMLNRGRKRQEHLAARLDGGSEPHVDAEAPLQVLDHGVVPALGLRGAGAGQEVRVFEAAHLEGIVFGVVACLQRVEHHVALGVQHQAHVGRVFLDAQDLALQFRAQVVPAESQFQAVVHVADELAARNVDVARDGLERQDAVAGLHAVGLLVDAQAPGDLRRLRLCVGARRLADEVGIHARDLGSLLHRHGSHALGELFEAVAPFLDEIVVVEVFGNDDVEHGHGQRRVGARTQAQMPVGAGGNPVHARPHAQTARRRLTAGAPSPRTR